ncbi:peptidyl-tRNA hydrolase [Xylaria telfairii]|nr:peptidyl-tRNA hydrolase [Xylaria telfairii]
MLPPRLLVVSIGNQAPYYNCLHSAGHWALVGAQKASAEVQPPFTLEKYVPRWKRCMVSAAPPFTFIQSPTMMNDCGHFVLAAYRATLEKQGITPKELALILVHDELQDELGHARTREWDTSPRGHNGIKSVKNALLSHQSHGYPLEYWARVSVGIGRPVARTADVVIQHVLRNMTPAEKRTIETQGGPSVLEHLQRRLAGP